MEDTHVQPDQPDQPDWLQQRPEHSTTHSRRTDPVITVWQLPRLRLGGGRYTGRIDNTLVLVTRKGGYETFPPPARPTSLRRYVALYEVNTDPHSFSVRVPLPSTVDSFEFEAVADVTWRVGDPVRFVTSQERDVPALLTRELLRLMRGASRSHDIGESAAAEQAVQRAVERGAGIGEREGLWVSCSIRLRRDASERAHQDRLRTALHEKEAAAPEHEVAVLRDQQDRQLMTEKIKFYESQLAKGGIGALSLHLAEHREDTSLVLEHLRADQAELVKTQLHLIDQVLESKGLEDYQLEEPHRLIAERMTEILKPTDPPRDEPEYPYPELPPQPEAEKPGRPE
ncbi:hypothetical protein AB0I66_38320 [Streptomyces sp. NPDC050439]|uniref:hypothetical protein n=1 Tax=unclassified Streptomyces TaxID=2593676 RepID=UPI003436B8C4